MSQPHPSRPLAIALHYEHGQVPVVVAKGQGEVAARIVQTARANDVPIDNNPVENAIRPIALGKKNWLFAGSERAGKRAAAIQSLLATAKLNGLEPAAWLKSTLERLPTCPNSRIDELLPIKR